MGDDDCRDRSLEEVAVSSASVLFPEISSKRMWACDCNKKRWPAETLDGLQPKHFSVPVDDVDSRAGGSQFGNLFEGRGMG